MITWNFPNWLTVFGMAVLGYLFVSIAVQLVRGRMGMKAPANANTPGGTSGAFSGIFNNSMFKMAA